MKLSAANQKVLALTSWPMALRFIECTKDEKGYKGIFDDKYIVDVTNTNTDGDCLLLLCYIQRKGLS